MKKLISILLVAVLILGMFPATALTAFAADTYENATSIAVGDTVILVCESKGMEMSTIGSQKYGEGKAYSGTPTGLVPLTVEEGYTTGTYSFKAPAGTYLYWTSGNYLQLNGNKTANTSWTVEFSSGNAVIKNAKDTSRQIQWNASSPRFSTYTSTQTAIQLYKLSTGGSTEPDCEHTNQVAIGEAADATCTEPGITAGVKCADCGEVITAQEELPATGHNYVDGACSVCGAEEPDGYVLTDIADIQPTDKVVITMTTASGTVYALPNNGGAATPTATIITVTGNTLAETPADTLLWNIGGSTGAYILYPNGQTDTWLYHTSSNSGVRIGTTAATYSIDSTGYLKDSNQSRYLGVYTTKPDWRCYTNTTGNTANQTLGFYVQSAGSTEPTECDHTLELQTEEKTATCTETGTTAYYACACGEFTEGGTEIAALGHNMVEGICSRCGLYEHQADVMAAAPGNGDKIIIHHVASNSALGLAANGDDLVGIATTPAESKLPYYTSVAILTVGKIGDTYTFANADGHYLSTTGSNALSFVDAADANSYWTVTLTEGNFIITNAGAGTLGLEYYNGAFTTYTAGTGDYFQMALYLVEPGANACEHENTVEQNDGYAPTCTQPGKTNSWICANEECGATVTPQESIDPTGHSYVDDVCETCGAAAPARYYIATYRDSEEQYYYMTSDLEDNKRYQAVATNVLPSKIDSDEALSNHVFILTDNGDGTYYLQAENVTGDNYLNHTGSSNTGTYTSAENAPKLTISDSAEVEGAKNIHFTSDAERYLSLNGTKDNNYFAWYKGTQKQDLVLIPVEDVEEAETITMTLYGAVDGITVSDNQVLDLNGKAATNVTGTDIRVYDSTATYTKAADGTVTVTEGTGTLTLTEGSTVVIDNTVDGLRYIALKGEENTYTFHILELKLSDITLRASAAGIYYKAIMNCDDTLKGAVAYHGMLVSVKNMPGADFRSLSEDGENGWTEIAGAPSGEKFTSCSVFGIFKPGRTDNTARGEMKIYANAYIQLAGTDEIIVADTSYGDKVVNEDGTKNEAFNGIAWSLKDVMQALNTKFDTLDETDQANVVKFYKAWSTAMNPWELGNIVAAATTPAE